MLIHYRCCIYVPSSRPFSSTYASWSLNIFLLIETVADASSGKCFLQLSLSLAVSKLYFMKTLSGVLTLDCLGNLSCRDSLAVCIGMCLCGSFSETPLIRTYECNDIASSHQQIPHEISESHAPRPKIGYVPLL